MHPEDMDHGIDDGLSTSGAGHWLFKDKDLLMGPVPASVLIDKLYAGEVGPDTPVADENDDGRWLPLREVPVFTTHVAKAQARQRVLEEKRAHEAKVRRKKSTRLVLMVLSGGLVVAGVFAVVVWLVSSQPWQEEDDALADLEITMNPPAITLASAEDLTRGEELFLDVDVEKETKTTRPRRRRPRTRPAASSSKTATPPPEAAKEPAAETTQADPDGLATTQSYDMDHIRTILNKESRSLFPCIREEVRRSGFSGTIPFSFVINNQGRVERLWIDQRRLRGGEMQSCFERVMSRWRFGSFQGERPTVNHSFTIGG